MSDELTITCNTQGKLAQLRTTSQRRTEVENSKTEQHQAHSTEIQLLCKLEEPGSYVTLPASSEGCLRWPYMHRMRAVAKGGRHRPDAPPGGEQLLPRPGPRHGRGQGGVPAGGAEGRRHYRGGGARLRRLPGTEGRVRPQRLCRLRPLAGQGRPQPGVWTRWSCHCLLSTVYCLLSTAGPE